MGSLIDVTGQKFGRLTVVRKTNIKAEAAMWECICDCGNTVIVRSDCLRSGNTKSCGCYAKELFMEYRKTNNFSVHKGYGTRLYRIWSSMKGRCYNKNHKYYKHYGGRGITICEEWKKDFSLFREWSYSNGYKEDMSIDRIDNDKGYFPDNCRYIYYKDQPKNRRSNHIVTINGEEMTASECSRKYNIPLSTVIFRANKNRDILSRVRRW